MCARSLAATCTTRPAPSSRASPVHVAPSTAYTIRLTRPAGGIIAVDGARAAGILSLYDDGRVGYSPLPSDPQHVLGTTPESVFLTMGVDVEH